MGNAEHFTEENKNVNYKIREMRREEIPLLDDFLYNAIFIPNWYTEEIPKDIIYNDPKIFACIKDFGSQPDDHCLVAEAAGKVIGAVWVRIANEYGHLSEKTGTGGAAWMPGSSPGMTETVAGSTDPQIRDEQK